MGAIEQGNLLQAAVGFWKRLKLKSERIALLEKANGNVMDFGATFPPEEVITYLVNHPEEME